jgi:hypothetical protein
MSSSSSTSQMIEEGKGATKSINDDGATASQEANGDD